MPSSLKSARVRGDTDDVRAGRRLLIAALWPTAFLVAVQLLGAAPAWAHGPAYNAAAQMQTRHVVVDATMESAVPAARAGALEAAIGSKPVFVAVLPVSAGQFELVEIESIHGEPGVYMLLEDGRLKADVVGEHGITARQASDAVLAAMSAHPDDQGAALTDAVDRELTALGRYGVPQGASHPLSTTQNGPDGWPIGLTVLLVGLLLILVAAGAAIALRVADPGGEPAAPLDATSGAAKR
jgi:hypothetical protein